MTDVFLEFKPIVQIFVPSNRYGDPITDTGRIGLTRIEFNRSFWSSMTDLSDIQMVEGWELVIRRKGRFVEVSRRREK